MCCCWLVKAIGRVPRLLRQLQAEGCPHGTDGVEAEGMLEIDRAQLKSWLCVKITGGQIRQNFGLGSIWKPDSKWLQGFTFGFLRMLYCSSCPKLVHLWPFIQTLLQELRCPSSFSQPMSFKAQLKITPLCKRSMLVD